MVDGDDRRVSGIASQEFWPAWRVGVCSVCTLNNQATSQTQLVHCMCIASLSFYSCNGTIGDTADSKRKNMKDTETKNLS